MKAESSWRRYARFWGSNVEADIEEELHLHLEMRLAEAKARGLNDADAQAEVARAFGDVEAVRAQMRLIASRREQRVRRFRLVSDFVQDVGQSTRGLWKRPGYSVSVIAILAIALGATTSILSVVNGVLLSPLPYAAPDRLAVIWEHHIPRDKGENVVAVPTWEDLSAQTRSFSSIAALVPDHATLLGDRATRLQGASVSAEWFAVTGVNPRIGRAFTGAEAANDAAVIVLSDAMWKSHFGGLPGVIGRTVHFADRDRTIVGVMPSGFEPPSFGWLDAEQQYWVPFGANASNRTWGRFLLLAARMRTGVTVEAADAELKAWNATRVPGPGNDTKDWTVDVRAMRDQMTGDVKTSLVVMFVAAALLLATALVNVSNLLMLRFQRRRAEFAMRSALGAGKARLVRQLVAEALTIVAAAAPAGLLAGMLMLHALKAVMPEDMPRAQHIHIDYRILACMGGLLFGTTLLLGLLPALRVTRARLDEWIRAGSARVSGRSAGAGIVIAEIALAIVLSIGAGLALRTYINLRTEKLGFEPDQTLSFRIMLDGARYETPEQRERMLAAFAAALRRTNDVADVAFTTIRPLAGGGTSTTVARDGSVEQADQPFTDVRIVSPSYFRALRVPVTDTAAFGAARASSGRVAILSRSAARQLFGDENPIGKRVHVNMNNGITAEVVAIAGDTRAHGAGAEVKPMLYFPLAQDVPARVDVLVRSISSDASTTRAVTAAIERALHDLDTGIAIEDMTTLPTVIASATRQQKTTMLLVGSFAAIALLLAAAGIYAVMATQVTDRRRELGIRHSLGATPARLRLEILRTAARNVALGGLLGVSAAAYSVHFAASLLYGITGLDPLTYAAVLATVVTVAAAAAALPAAAAARSAPAEALRHG